MGRSPVIFPGVMLRTAVVVLAVSSALAGCSADAEPRSLPPVPVVSPTPAVLSIPPEAMAETPQGAAAFVRYYFGDVVNQAYATLDAAQVAALSGTECASCANVVADVERLRDASVTVAGSRFKIAFAEAAPSDEDGSIVVDLRFSSDPYVEVSADGTTVREEPAQVDVDAQVKVVRQAEAWVVAAIATST